MSYTGSSVNQTKLVAFLSKNSYRNSLTSVQITLEQDRVKRKRIKTLITGTHLLAEKVGQYILYKKSLLHSNYRENIGYDY